MKVFFSVIIPALNEEHFLPRLLRSLQKQQFTNFEVILVDSESKDKTISEAKKFGKYFPLTILTNTKRNVSRSRNMGAEKANGEYIFFIDADNSINSNFLLEMEKKLIKGYDMIVPAVTPDSKKLFHRVNFFLANRSIQILRKIDLYFSTGGNLLVHKTAFNTLHGFDESLFICEDHDLVQRAKKEGFRVGFSYNPKVMFSVRRLEKEGAAVALKYFVSSIYIIFFGKITKKIYNYEMGGEYFEHEK